MRKIWLLNLIKTILFLILFSIVYYSLFLRPKITLQKNLSEAKKVLSLHKNNLVQNKLAYVSLTKLDSRSANFDFEKTELVSTLKKTNEEGIKLIESEKTLPKVNTELNERFPALLQDSKDIYQKQKELLEKVYVTKSYGEGLEILKSKEAVELLTDQTNLILSFDFQIRKLEKELERINSII